MYKAFQWLVYLHRWPLNENPSMKCQGSQIKRLNDLKLASSLTSNQSILKIQIESDDQKKEN